MYIYIYTSVSPCITCTKQSGAEQKLIPIKDEHEAAVFEQPFRTQETNARAGSSGTRRAFCASGVARAAHVEHSAVPRQTRAAPVEHSAAPGQTRAALFEYSAAPGRARAAISSDLQPGQARAAKCSQMQQIATFRAKAGEALKHPKTPKTARREANFNDRYTHGRGHWGKTRTDTRYTGC